jgi:hypothetical protein
MQKRCLFGCKRRLKVTSGRHLLGLSAIEVPEGQGKVGPKLGGTSLSADQISDLLTKGDDSKKAPHKKAMGSLSADDAKAVAGFVKSLK